MNAKVEAIFVASAAGATPRSVASAELVAGQGIRGDRYFEGKGTFSKSLKDLPDRELTLIEREEIERFNGASGHRYDDGAFRRNIVVSGIRLNELVDKTFQVGDVTVRGIRLCEPCKYLGGCLVPEVETAMAGKAGLRAQILASGTVALGDPVGAREGEPNKGAR